MDPYDDRQTVDWEDLDKKRFYTYGITFFMGVRALLYPPFLLKTKIQVARGASEQSSFQVAKATVREEGLRGLYKGFWISSTSLVFRQVYFTTYEVVRHNLGPESDLYRRLGPEKGELVRNMSAGATSSTVMQCFTVPLDIIGQRMMVDRPRGSTNGTSSSAISSATPVAAAGAGGEARAPPQGGSAVGEEGRNQGRGVGAGTRVGGGGAEAEAEARPRGRKNITAREVARQVYAESGLRGFYRGFGVSVLQFAPTSAIWWAAYGVYSRAIVRALGNLPAPLPTLTAQQRQVGGQAAAGFCTGMTTVLITNPLDVLRTRLQVEGRQGDHRTLASEYRILMAESGPKGLMRGLGPRILAMAPASVLVVSVYELIKRLSRKTPLPLQPPPPPPPPATASISITDADKSHC
ncbi:unnamed protein product [Pylaiella littoralis]